MISASAAASPGRRQPVGGQQLRQRADRSGGDGQTGRHRLGGGEAEGLVGPRGQDRHPGAGPQPGELVAIELSGERDFSAPCLLLQRVAVRTVPSDHQRHAGAPARVDREVDPLFRRQPRREHRGAVGWRARGRRERPDHVRQYMHRRRLQRRSELKEPPVRALARDDEAVDLRREPALPPCQADPVDDRLKPSAAAVQPHPRQGVAA